MPPTVTWQVPLDVDNWFGDGEQCWKRAIGLCRMIGPAGADHLDRIETSLIEALDSATTEDKFFGHGLADHPMVRGTWLETTLLASPRNWGS